MLPVIPVLVGGLAAVASFIIKHPFVAKMMMFTIFTSLIGTASQYLLSLAQSYIIGNPLLQLAALFGVLQALSLFLSILIAGFGVKQVLAFVRS